MFQAWPKIKRFSALSCVIEEKIDGTNAQILIESDEVVMVGSRKRIITPGKDTDNYGFAGWVEQNKDQLVRLLGNGRHYGEWYGNGIQRNYGMSEKRFALFNPRRYEQNPHIVESDLIDICPALYYGVYTADIVAEVMETLHQKGSTLVPGFMQPEGVILRIGDNLFKETFEFSEGKWKEAA